MLFSGNLIKQPCFDEMRKSHEGYRVVGDLHVTDHIMENIGGIKDILDSINNGVVKDTKDAYLQLDEELGEFNKNPQTAEGE